MADAERPRFIADCMLGRLAKWMRVLGYDVAYDRRIGDDALIARAWREGRTLLTRDRRLIQRRALRSRGVRGLLVESADPEAQLAQVTASHPPPPPEDFLGRCLRCNELTVAAPREEVAPLVPPYVYRTQERFSRCPACGRIYWKATHVEDMRRRLRGIRAPGASRG